MTRQEKFMAFKHVVHSPVYVTTDYSIFENSDGNRHSKEKQLKKLKASYEDEQLELPAVVNEFGVIIDGKHRFTTSKAMKKPFYYIIRPGYGDKQMKKINMETPSVAWTNEDCLEFYVKKKVPAYIEFLRFEEKHAGIKTTKKGGETSDFKFATLLAVLTLSKSSLKKFRRGELTIPNYAASEELIKRVKSFKPYFPSFYTHREFALTVSLLFKQPNYNHERMIERCKTRKSEMEKTEKGFDNVFPFHPNTTSLMVAFENVYNCKNTGGHWDSFPYKTEHAFHNSEKKRKRESEKKAIQDRKQLERAVQAKLREKGYKGRFEEETTSKKKGKSLA